MNKKRGQIWVETVIYTLIGLAIIAVLLAIVRPVIEEKKDQIIIEQSLNMINSIDGKIEDIRYYGVGNSRPLLVDLNKGELIINTEQDSIEFFMESRYKYSEPGIDVKVGRVIARTNETREGYKISLMLDYSGSLDLTLDGVEAKRVFQPAPTSHKITITNNGTRNDLLQIDFIVV